MAEDKIKIIAYKKIDFSGEVGNYTLRFNPDKLVHNFSISWDGTQAFGTSGTENKYRHTNPETIGFQFIFDSSITVKDDPDGDPPKVESEINTFKDLVFTYNGDIHRPNFLKLVWGNFLFKGQLSKLDLAYTAFTPEGEPLKATADALFVQVKDNASRLSAENKSSPDLTHYYVIKEGDTLPMLAERTYGDPSYYIDLAIANNLNNFRVLTAGDKLILPPIEK